MTTKTTMIGDALRVHTSDTGYVVIDDPKGWPGALDHATVHMKRMGPDVVIDYIVTPPPDGFIHPFDAWSGKIDGWRRDYDRRVTDRGVLCLGCIGSNVVAAVLAYVKKTPVDDSIFKGAKTATLLKARTSIKCNPSAGNTLVDLLKDKFGCDLPHDADDFWPMYSRFFD